MHIEIIKLKYSDVFSASKMMADSCRSVYRGIMNDEYLDSISDDQYVKFLETGLNEKAIDCFLAVENLKIIGVSITRKSKIDYYPDDAELYAIYLLPNYIGKGLGRKLYLQSELLIKQQGYNDMSLVVLAQNNIAIEFYKRNGYVKTEFSTMVNLKGQELSCDIMRKRL